MSEQLHMKLTITGFLPAERERGQLWKGGVTDRQRRAMTPEPAYWLSLDEFDGEKLEGVPSAAAAHLSWHLRQTLPGDKLSPDDAGGLILVSMDIVPEAEEEFNDWYVTEHIPILSKVPGMISARRFQNFEGSGRSPKYVALYHVTDVKIYAIPEWTVANDTPWTLRMRRYQRNRTYFMFNKRVR